MSPALMLPSSRAGPRIRTMLNYGFYACDFQFAKSLCEQKSI
jgi:hypothetical protein